MSRDSMGVETSEGSNPSARRQRKGISIENPKHALKRTIEQLTHSKRTWQVFADFCELSALTLANAVDLTPATHEARELRYQQIRKSYEPEEFARFPFAFACLVECLEPGYDDVLGALFMELDLGSHWHGQFFTPYSLAAMMARMTFDRAQLDDGREFVTLQEPAAGAGGMCIAFADAMRAEGFNPQRQLHVTAVDVDQLCVHMAFVQLSLLHIPALIIHGNTLSGDVWSRWYTPAHVLGLWGVKLRRSRADAALSSDRAAEQTISKHETVSKSIETQQTVPARDDHESCTQCELF